ncbi:MAG: MFS transporter [Verrucomicrobia bacterium]|nr:MFS transporter [Verrucomicrobiota bacterium]
MNARTPAASETDAPAQKGLLRHLGLGAGGAVENSFQNAPLGLANPIFNVGMGISPVLVGFAMAFPRIWEIFLDPWIGTVSDRTRHRLGKRLPYIFLGLAGSLFFFVAMWWAPAGWSKTALGIWLLVTAFLFYTFYSFFSIPYAALTIEATRAGPDRIGVMSARTAFANLSQILINWLYWFCQREWFSSPVAGMRWVGLGFGLLITGCGVLVIATTLRRGLHLHSGHEQAAPIAKGSYRKILQWSPVRSLLVALLSTMIGFTLVGHLGFYLVAYHACGGDLKQASLVTAVKSTVTQIAAVLVCPLIGAAAKRLGKDRVFQGLIGLGVVSSLAMWWLITPANPYLSMVSDLGISLCLVGFWLLMPAFLGDISDAYEKATGQSCQGTLSALYGIAVKVGASSALLLTGYILVFCGFNAEMPLAEMVRPLVGMRILFALVPALGLALSSWAMRRFRFAPELRG